MLLQVFFRLAFLLFGERLEHDEAGVEQEGYLHDDSRIENGDDVVSEAHCEARD
jgi:hypothetical protein